MSSHQISCRQVDRIETYTILFQINSCENRGNYILNSLLMDGQVDKRYDVGTCVLSESK